MEQHMTEHGTKEEKKRLELPKNIRQMGNIQGSTRIYMEDYVYTYLHGKADAWNHRGCILLGNRFQDNGQRYLFISGLVRLPEECFTDGIPEFTDITWGLVYQKMKHFYENVEILGWGMDVAGASAKLTGDLERIHRDAFQGQDKLIFLMDSLEKEEAFYVYEKNMLRRRDGYYIYYEKNPQMREYMMQDKDKKEKESGTEEDPQQAAVKNYRNISARNSKKQRSLLGSMVQVACLALLVALSAMVVSTISSTAKMQRLLEAVSYLKADETTASSSKEETDQADIPQVSVTESGSESDMESDSKSDSESESKSQSESVSDAEALISGESGTDENDMEKESPTVVSRDTAETSLTAAEEETESAEAADQPGEGDSGDDTAEPAAESYVVQPGESLLSISHRIYGKDYTRQICELNNLEDQDKIYAGQELFLPAVDNQ